MAIPGQTYRPTHGAVAAGHPRTAEAAVHALNEGGNAFDAVVAAHWCACISEPVLTSLGGGGFLLARAEGQAPTLYDFFAQTPLVKKPPDEIDFYPIQADFGTTQQEFHIGYGATATPGTVHGLFQIHRDLCKLPMKVLMEPAIDLAIRGVEINPLQAFIFDVVKPICLATETTAAQFSSQRQPSRLVSTGDTLRLPKLAETLGALADEGDRLFYEGDIAAEIEAACRDTGHLTREDLASYSTIRRQPLRVNYRHAQLFTNPAPASGGLLIGFALKLLEKHLSADSLDNEAEYIQRITDVMHDTNEARIEHLSANKPGHELLDEELMATYVSRVRGRARAYRGTTHISVIDAEGNVAALTTSNGEGCGHLVGSTGMMLNNMLGEEDLNPHGFQRWQENRRLTSMMSPGMLMKGDGSCIALGSGGSNRIRSAILQVVSALVDSGISLESAIQRPRVHFEQNRLNIEAGFSETTVSRLREAFDQLECWPDLNLYFGGVHAVASNSVGFDAYGDPRRGGVAVRV